MKEFSLSYLTYNELAVAGRRLARLAGGDDTQYLFIRDLCTMVAADSDELDSSLNKKSGNEDTAKLRVKDGTRDNAYLFLRDLVYAFTRIDDAAKKEAALKLYAEFENLGLTLYQQGYTEQSAKMQSLVKILSGPELTAALELIGAKPWFDSMSAAQADFEDFYDKKIENEGKKEHLGLKEARNKLTFHLHTLLDAIVSANDIKDGVYAPLITRMDEVITDIMTSVRARRSREKNEKENEIDNE